MGLPAWSSPLRVSPRGHRLWDLVAEGPQGDPLALTEGPTCSS